MQSLNLGMPSSLQMVSFDHSRCNHQQSVMQSFIIQRCNQVASKDRLKIFKKSLDIQNQAVHFNTRQANVTWRMSSGSLGVNMKSLFLVVSAWERIRILHLKDRPIWVIINPQDLWHPFQMTFLRLP